MGGRLLEGLTMVGGTSDWNEELGCFLKPFLDRLGHKARRRMCPLYVSGLIPTRRLADSPGDFRIASGVIQVANGGCLPWAKQFRCGRIIRSARFGSLRSG